jgi:hypothetical protein
MGQFIKYQKYKQKFYKLLIINDLVSRYTFKAHTVKFLCSKSKNIFIISLQYFLVSARYIHTLFYNKLHMETIKKSNKQNTILIFIIIYCYTFQYLLNL